MKVMLQKESIADECGYHLTLLLILKNKAIVILEGNLVCKRKRVFEEYLSKWSNIALKAVLPLVGEKTEAHVVLLRRLNFGTKQIKKKYCFSKSVQKYQC